MSSAINKQIGTLANVPITYEHRLISYSTTVEWFSQLMHQVIASNVIVTASSANA